MFLFVLSYCSIYLYIIRYYRFSYAILFLPFLLYFLVAATQYNVGTDYFNYINIFNNSNEIDRFRRNGETFFYYLVKFLQETSSGPQSLFFFVSFIQSSLIWIYLKKIAQLKFLLWLFFIIFFCTTNIYNNQLNGLRQYIVICAMPLLSLSIYNKRYIYSIFAIIILSLFHKSAYLAFSLIALISFYKLLGEKVFTLFLISAFIFFIFGKYTGPAIDILIPRYSHYLNTKFGDPYSISTFFTKLYYTPIILIFYYLYAKQKIERRCYINFGIFVFSTTYWGFLLALNVGIIARIYQYFVFFYVFPIYWLLAYFYNSKKIYAFLISLTYIITPYIIKVTILADAEFKYQSYIFN